MNEFNTELGATTFKNKYASNTFETWRDRTHTIVNDVCGTRNGTDMPIMSKSDRDYLIKIIIQTPHYLNHFHLILLKLKLYSKFSPN